MRMRLQSKTLFIFSMFKFISITHCYSSSGIRVMVDNFFASNRTYLCEQTERCLHKGVCQDKGYDSEVTPGGNSTQVYVEIMDLRIINIRRKENNIKFSISQRLSWLDHRITVDSTYLNFFTPPGIRKKKPLWYWNKHDCEIWYPNEIQVQPVVQGKKLTNPVDFMIFAVEEVIPFAGGDRNSTTIIMGQQYEPNIACNLEVDKFPFDNHECTFKMSNEETREIQLLLWNKGRLNNTNIYYRDGFNISVDWYEVTVGEGISYIKFDLRLMRISSPFIFQYYLPCIAVVCVSQISFIIPPSSVPGRIALLATLFLTLTNLFINHMVKGIT